MPRGAQFTLLGLWTLCGCLEKHNFLGRKCYQGYMSANPQKENEDRGNKNKVITSRQKGKTAKYQDDSRMNN